MANNLGGGSKSARLLVGGLVGGVEVEQDFGAFSHLFCAEADELLAEAVTEADQIAGAGRVSQRLNVG